MERDVEERTLLNKATLQNDCVEMRVPPQHVSERLVRVDRAGKEWSARRIVVEPVQDTVDQSGDVGEQAPIVAEERPKCLRHHKDELSMGKLEQDVVGQMLGKEDRPLPDT